MATDPWATDEPKAPSTPTRDNHSEVNVEPGVDKVNVTLKAGPTQDSPWITIDRRTPADILALLGVEPTKDPTADLKALMETVAKSSAYFASVFRNVKGNDAPAETPRASNNGGGNNYRRGEPAGATQGQGEHPGTCAHGVRYEWKSGINQNTQKPYRGYYCVAKGVEFADKCPPVRVD